MDVVLHLRKPLPLMTRRGTDTRVLKWTFRRQHETVICQLGLNSDHSAYELRLNPPWDLQSTTTEIFDDAMPAFQRHAAIERVLVDEGWLLEGFESVNGAALAQRSVGG
jgi:hypothetical protein